VDRGIDDLALVMTGTKIPFALDLSAAIGVASAIIGVSQDFSPHNSPVSFLPHGIGKP
jgi:hypothetical protein